MALSYTGGETRPACGIGQGDVAAWKKPQDKDGPFEAQGKPEQQGGGLRYPMKVNE
jgi:hypothetical protein